MSTSCILIPAKGSSSNLKRPHEALTNDLILSLIFSYLDVTSLKSVRLVCRKWSLIGSMQMRKVSGYVTLRSQIRTRELLTLLLSSPCIPYDSFEWVYDHVVLYGDTYPQFFSKINARRLRILPGMNFSVLREMLVFYMYNVEELTVSLELFSHLEVTTFFLEDHKKIRNPLMPKLRSLSVYFEDLSCQFLQDIFQAAPLLENLHILQTHPEVEGEQAIRALKGFHGKRFKSVTLLQNGYRMLRDELDSLTEFFKGNEAKEIWIRFQPIGMNVQSLVKFFTAIAEYVEYFDYALNFDLSALPVMKKLRNLETNQWSVLGDLHKTFPALESLRLGSIDESVSHSILAPAEIPEFTKLTHLHILEYEGFKLITCEELLSRTFSGLPNVRKLCLHCVDKTLPVICGRLRNLEELRLGSESLITDEGITGIPMHFCKDISHLNFPTAVVGDPKRLRFKGIPWFDKCKNLRLFHIEPPPRKHGKLTTRRHITNNSVFFGFAFMKSLRNLSIPHTQIDDDALTCISKHRQLRLVQMNVTGCLNLSSKGIEALRSRRRRLQVINSVRDGEYYDTCDPRYLRRLRMEVSMGPPPNLSPLREANQVSGSEESDSDF